MGMKVKTGQKKNSEENKIWIRHISAVPDSTEGASKTLLLPRPIQENTSNFQKEDNSKLTEWQIAS